MCQIKAEDGLRAVISETTEVIRVGKNNLVNKWEDLMKAKDSKQFEDFKVD